MLGLLVFFKGFLDFKIYSSLENKCFSRLVLVNWLLLLKPENGLNLVLACLGSDEVADHKLVVEDHVLIDTTHRA